MECTICKSGKMKDGKVSVMLERDDSVIITKGTPASVCENCGEYTLEQSVSKKIMNSAEQAVAINAEIEVLNYVA